MSMGRKGDSAINKEDQKMYLKQDRPSESQWQVGAFIVSGKTATQHGPILIS